MSGNRRWHWFCLALVLVFLGLAATTVAGGTPASVDVADNPAQDVPDDPSPSLPPGTGAAPASVRDELLGSAPPRVPAGIESIAGSDVTTSNCYEASKVQTMCFEVFNGSTDDEWLDRVGLTFPNYAGLGPWAVTCNSQDEQDSNGSAVALGCSTPSDNEVVYADSDADGIGEVSAGATWGFCVSVTIPAGYNGPRYVSWSLSGDEEAGSSPPHDVTGSTEMEMCDPLMLRPTSRVTEGCNGVTKTYDFELWNNTGAAGTFTLTYDVSSGNGDFAGPSGVSLTAGETVSVTTQLKPHLCLGVGDVVVATLNVEGGGHTDSATIIQSVSEYSGWEQRAPSPKPAMDNAVAWAVDDGGLWSVGGYGADRAVQRYDPNADSWVTYTQQMTPAIEYPMDGCYGIDEDGHEVIVLFPDTIYTGTLQRYDITDDTWDEPPIPTGYPPEGRWGHDVASLYAQTGENICYLSGGSTQVGGGRVRDLWTYYPATNTAVHLGSFSPQVGPFGFHASWYVPWVGTSGAVCVGGGIDHNSQVTSATQCYDLAARTFNTPNADLGTLPEPWWGMADGWKEHNGSYQVWIANGVAEDGTLIGKSAYADETTGGFVYGPESVTKLYRLEGDSWEGHLYVEQGAKGGYDYSSSNELLVQCPACIEWGKLVVGTAWSPAITITVETSDTIEVIDVFTTNQPLTLFEYWDSDELQLLDWSVQPAFGSVVAGTGELTWDLLPSGFQVVTLTKLFHVEPCTWTQTVITEVLGSQQQVLEERLVEIEKEAAALWIESYYDPAGVAGQSAFFTLEYGNAGGYENNVSISNTFPITAPFVWSDPPPTAQDPGGLWARWDVGDVSMGSAGAIVVEVSLDPRLVPSTTVRIWDGIFNHVGELQDDTIIEFTILPARVYLPLVMRNHGG